MSIEKLNPAHLSELQEMYLLDFFNNDLGRLNTFMDNYYDQNLCYCKIVDGHIASSLHIMPVEMKFRGGFHTSYAVHSMITHRDHRGKGYAGELLAHAQRIMKDANTAISFLMPAGGTAGAKS